MWTVQKNAYGLVWLKSAARMELREVGGVRLGAFGHYTTGWGLCLLGNEKTVKGFEQESELYGQIYMNWNGKSLEFVVKASVF